VVGAEVLQDRQEQATLAARAEQVAMSVEVAMLVPVGMGAIQA
jgi:hypothetical protein